MFFGHKFLQRAKKKSCYAMSKNLVKTRFLGYKNSLVLCPYLDENELKVAFSLA